MLKYKYKIIKYFMIVIFFLTAGIVYSLEVEQGAFCDKGDGDAAQEKENNDYEITAKTYESSDSKTVDYFGETDGGNKMTDIADREVTAGNTIEKDSVSTLCVYVCGKVSSPGVYELPSGSRITDAVEAAGGMTENADADYLNLALFLSDGQKIYVPSTDEVMDNGRQAEKLSEMSECVSGPTVVQGNSAGSNAININSAGLSELLTIPGIGEKRAQTIIDYRNNAGPFKTVADIKKVSGIKDALYEKIKEYICVE